MMQPDISDKISSTGSAWDGLIGMLWLLHNHPKECVVIPKGLLKASGKFRDHGYGMISFTDTTLEWYHKTQSFLAPPQGFWESVKDCLKKGSKFIVIPMGFKCNDEDEDRISGHANFLIYNSITKEMERFEPNGSGINDPCFGDKYNSKLTEKIILLFNKNAQKDMIKTFYEPLDFCPTDSFQSIQGAEGKSYKGERAFCLAWSFWYADTRLRNPNKDREEVVDMALESLRDNKSVSFTSFIRSFSAFLTKVGLELLKTDDPAEVFKKYTLKYT
jgi:hypothetical protein